MLTKLRAFGQPGRLGFSLSILALVERAPISPTRRVVCGRVTAGGDLVAPHLLDPDAWGRSSTLSAPLRPRPAAIGNRCWRTVLGALAHFQFRRRQLYHLQLAGRPIFIQSASVFFYGGLALCVWRWKSPCMPCWLMWIAAAFCPRLGHREWTSTAATAKRPKTADPALPRRVRPPRSGDGYSIAGALPLGKRFGAGLRGLADRHGASPAMIYLARLGANRPPRARLFHTCRPSPIT